MVVLLVILKILLYLLLVIAGLFLLLLLVPFNYKGHLAAADGFRAELAAGWAWKLLGINAEVEGKAVDITLRVLDRRVYRLKKKEGVTAGEAAEEKPKKAEKDKRAGRGLSLKDITDKAFINEILGYLKKVLDIAKPKYLHLYGTYGFDDPSLTGMVCGAAGIIKSIIPDARLHLVPDFTREVLELDMRAEGSMTAGSLAYQTIRTVLKKPVRKIIFRKKKS